MGHPITWRNVTNTVTGNPASALATAVTAFGAAGAQGDRIVQRSREQDQLDLTAEHEANLRRALEDDDFTLSDIASSEGGIPSALLEAQQAFGLNQASIAANEASILSNESTVALREQQTISATFDNSVEERERTAALADAEMRIAEQNANAATSRAASSKTLANQQAARVAKAEVAELQRVGVQEAYFGEYSEAAAAKVDGARDAIIAGIETRNPGLEDTDYQLRFEEERKDLIQKELSDGLRDFITSQMKRYPSMTAEQLAQTVPGHQYAEAVKIAGVVAGELAKQEATRRQTQQTAADSIAKSGGTNLTKMRPTADGKWRFSTAAEGALQPLTKGSEVAFINRELTFNIDDDDAGELQTVLKTLGGNPEALKQVMAKAGVRNDDFFGSDTIDWDKANKHAVDLKKILVDQASQFNNSLKVNRPLDVDDIIRESQDRAADERATAAAGSTGTTTTPSTPTGPPVQNISQIAEELVNPTSTPATAKAEKDYVETLKGFESALRGISQTTRRREGRLIGVMELALQEAKTGKSNRPVRGGRGGRGTRVIDLSVKQRTDAATRTQEILRQILDVDLQVKRDQNERTRAGALASRLTSALEE